MGAKANADHKAQLFVHFSETSMQLAGYAGGQLGIYNQFDLKTPERAAKLMLMSLQQFSKQGQATPIVVWGLERHVSSHVPLLKKYYKNLTIGEKPKGLRMSHIFDQLAPYEYFDIMSSFR